MSFERIFEGTIDVINHQTKTLRVTQEIRKKGSVRSQSISFNLEPNASVMSSSRGMLKFAELKVGQNVLVHYVTESDGKDVANTIALVEPATNPTSFSGVRVAG